MDEKNILRMINLENLLTLMGGLGRALHLKGRHQIVFMGHMLEGS
jgi:hypothetical protein